MVELSSRRAQISGKHSELGASEFRAILVLALLLLGCGGLAFYFEMPIAAAVLALPGTVLATVALLMSPILCIAVLIFVQQNDVLIAVTGMPFLNKALALLAATAVLLNFGGWTNLRATLAAGVPVFAALAGLVLVSGLSVLHAEDANLAVSETVRLFNLSVLVAIVAFGIKDIRAASLVVIALIASTLAAAAVTMFDFASGQLIFSKYYSPDLTTATWEGEARSRGASLESVPMSATMMLSGTIIALTMSVRGDRWRAMFALAALVGAAAILTTLTRSATLTMGISTLIVLWWARREQYFGRLLAAIAIGTCFVVAFAPAANWTKLVAAASTADKTVERRLGYQIIGIDLVAKQPFLGVGAGNFPVHYAKHEYAFVPGRAEEPRPLHNIYLQFAAELGVSGALLFVAMLGAAVYSANAAAWWAQDVRLRAVSEAVLLSLIAMALQFFFLSSNAVPHFWISVGLAVAVLRLLLDERRASSETKADAIDPLT